MRRRDTSVRQAPDRQTWARLYELAVQVKALAPWEWMEETDVFGVEVPRTGELVFVGVMGQLGEHLAVAAYPGTRSLYDYWDVATGTTDVVEGILELPQVQLSFEDRELVEREDRAVMQQLRLQGRFRGRLAYPVFRSYRPGYAPWLIDAFEAEALACALEQLLDVAPRCRDQALRLGLSAKGRILLRVAGPEAGQAAWVDSHRALLEPQPLRIDCEVPAALADQVQALPQGDGRLDIGLFPSGAVVQARRSERPEMPYTLVVADPDAGIIVAAEMLTIDPDLPSLLAQVPPKVLEATVAAGVRPREVRVQEMRLAGILSNVCPDLQIRVVVDDLPLIEHVRREMLGLAGRE